MACRRRAARRSTAPSGHRCCSASLPLYCDLRIGRPGVELPLLFREEWKPTPGSGEHPLTPASLGNPNLDLTLIVPSGQINLAGKPGDENNPLHTWTGLCTSACGLALRDRAHFADLTGLARLRWIAAGNFVHQARRQVSEQGAKRHDASQQHEDAQPIRHA